MCGQALASEMMPARGVMSLPGRVAHQADSKAWSCYQRSSLRAAHHSPSPRSSVSRSDAAHLGLLPILCDRRRRIGRLILDLASAFGIRGRGRRRRRAAVSSSTGRAWVVGRQGRGGTRCRLPGRHAGVSDIRARPRLTSSSSAAIYFCT